MAARLALLPFVRAALGQLPLPVATAAVAPLRPRAAHHSTAPHPPFIRPPPPPRPRRYLTFCSYTMQLVQLLVCCLAHVARGPKRKRRLTAAADALSCAVFGIANTVTALFFAIEKSTQVRCPRAAWQLAGRLPPRLATSWQRGARGPALAAAACLAGHAWRTLAAPAGCGRAWWRAAAPPRPAIRPHKRGRRPLQGLVEGGGLERPPWLNLAVHVWNSVVAWVDLLIGEPPNHWLLSLTIRGWSVGLGGGLGGPADR